MQLSMISKGEKDTMILYGLGLFRISMKNVVLVTDAIY